MKNLLPTLLVLALFSSPLLSASTSVQGTPARRSLPEYKHVVVVILENADEDEAVQQPFLASLVKGGAYLKNYHGVTHPSQPNYIALISGDTQGVTNDGKVDLDGKHLGDLLEEVGKNWKVYADDYPGDCYLKMKSGKYVRKHVPFLSFTSVQNSSERCARIVNSDQFNADIQNGVLPDFALYVPNMDNDGHDTGVTHADQWLQETFASKLKDPKLMDDTLLIVTFDEGEIGFSNPDNQIYGVLVGKGVQKGASVSTSYNHYNMLRTIEEVLGLKTLGRNDANASVIDGVWEAN